jgi:hypothetical protein
MCSVTVGCECYAAVTRVYRELRSRNISDAEAFDTATRVYQYHHPEAPASQAPHQVALWLEELQTP